MQQLLTKWAESTNSTPKETKSNHGKKNRQLVVPNDRNALTVTTQAHNNENGSLRRWRAHNPCYWCRNTHCMVRDHGFKGQWPVHLSARYATHQSLWTAIRGLAQSGKSLSAIAKAMDVDISSWPALDKDDFLI